MSFQQPLVTDGANRWWFKASRVTLYSFACVRLLGMLPTLANIARMSQIVLHLPLRLSSVLQSSLPYPLGSIWTFRQSLSVELRDLLQYGHMSLQGQHSYP